VAKPVANFIASPISGCWPLAVTFTDGSTDVTGTFFTSYEWAYGDGATATVGTGTTSHIFVPAGTFATTEIVTDNIGCKDTVTHSLVTVWHLMLRFQQVRQHHVKMCRSHLSIYPPGP